MKKLIVFLIVIVIIGGCGKKTTVPQTKQPYIMGNTIREVTDSLLIKFDDTEKARIESGVKQVAQLWLASDGLPEDFKTFCLEQYLPHGDERDLLFDKLQEKMEILNGSFNKMTLDLKWNLDLDLGPVHPVDEIFGGFDPSSHLQEDLYANKIAFLTVLNFPSYTLEEKTINGESWTNREWAYARLGDEFTARVPSSLLQKYTLLNTNADIYISQYNIYSDTRTF